MPNDAPAAGSLLLMSPDDNCLIARMPLAAGLPVEIDGALVILPQAIGLGHKVARRAMRAGERVLRYGAPIGSLSAAVAIGAHIHTHNLESDYLPTYTLAGDGHHFIEHGQS